MNTKNKRSVMISGKVLLLILSVAFIITGCKKYLEVPLPTNQLITSAAFENDASAAAVINSILGEISVGPLFSGGSSIGYRTGLYTDELTNYSTTASVIAFYQDAVQNAYTGDTWTALYTQLYSTNLAIQGLRGTTATLLNKNQWLGEALFLRGMFYFYLVNLYGEVTLPLTPDYNVNNKLLRRPASEVYQQIITDLKEAEQLLSVEYKTATGVTSATDRARPNKAAVNALLARVYLYTEQWADAEKRSTSIIDSIKSYQLIPPASVFLVNSKETIWGLSPTYSANNIKDAQTYIMVDTSPVKSGVSVTLSMGLVNSFEPGDTRFTSWVGVAHAKNTDYYYAAKYKARAVVGTGTPPEYVQMLRLGEQYLIRAEARYKQGKISGSNSAESDINAIRARSGLTAIPTPAASTIQATIIKERRVELFTEIGQRMFDLRRTNMLDPVMLPLVPQKGGVGWKSYMQWWPIPTGDIYANPGLLQTPGYQ